MKAINCNTCRKKILKEATEEYKKQQYAIYRDLAYTFACYATTTVLMAFIRRGRSKKYIQQLFSDMVAIYDTPQMFGKDINLTDVMKRLEKEYGIDYKRIHVSIETEKQYMKGAGK